MTLYKLESDVDYHIVVQDENGNTMVTEIPCPCCVAAVSPFASAIANARQQFDAHLTATTFFQSVSIPVQITGVGFFDFIHGQTGVAPNGIELHPILDIRFLNTTTTTLASDANPSQYGQSVTFTATLAASNGGSIPTGSVTFKDGATVISSAVLNGSGQASFTSNSLSVGSHSITASYPGDSNSLASTSTVLTQVVNKGDQFITFSALAGKIFGDADFNVSATASSGLPVSFGILSGPATISGSTVHITGAGTVTVRASQAGDGNYNPAPNVDQSFEVGKAAQAISFAALSDKTYGDPPFTVSATGGGSGNSVTFSASGNCTSSGANWSTITITGAGPCTVTASQAGNANYNAAPDVPRSFTINQATANITVNGYSGIYDENAHGATGSATGVNGENLTSLLNLGASFTDVPGGTAHWTFAGNTNYASASGDVAITITKAPSTTTVTCPPSETYTGAALTPCSVAVTGTNLSLTPTANYANNTNVGTATASYTYAGDPNHDGSSDSKNFEIAKASSTTTVTCPTSETYTGVALTPCSVAVTGANLSLTPDAVYANNVNAGTATASYTYTGDANHDGSSDSKNFSIGQASSTVTVTCGGPYVYTGSAQTPCTAQATGVGMSPVDATASLVYGSNTNVGTATADASWGGDANHTGNTGSGSFSITQASSTTVVTVTSATYDGNPHGGTASVTGVGALSQSLTVTYSGRKGTVHGPSTTAPINAGDYTATAVFAGDANHTGSSDSKDFEITKATSTITWNNPADIVYGTALSPTQLNATANVSGTFSYTPASGTLLNAGSAQTLLASFTPTDSANYNPTSKNVQINVLKAAPVFSNLSSPLITYGTGSTNLSGKLSFGSLIPTGSVAITLNSVIQSAVIQAGGNFSSAFATGSLAPGSYSIAYYYAGDGNFNSASGSGTLIVGYGIVASYDQTAVHQSGSTIPIKLKITDANGNNLSTAGTVVTAVGISLVSTTVYGPVEDSGNANPDNNFRFTADSYTYNLQTTGLTTGVYNLYFTVGSDPTVHTVQFQIK